jgi:hypothetical protein
MNRFFLITLFSLVAATQLTSLDAMKRSQPDVVDVSAEQTSPDVVQEIVQYEAQPKLHLFQLPSDLLNVILRIVATCPFTQEYWGRPGMIDPSKLYFDPSKLNIMICCLIKASKKALRSCACTCKQLNAYFQIPEQAIHTISQEAIASALSTALKEHSVSLLQIRSKDILGRDTESTFHIAVRYGDQDVMKVLFLVTDDKQKLLFDTNSYRRHSLHIAARHNKIQEARLILRTAQEKAGELLLRDDGHTNSLKGPDTPYTLAQDWANAETFAFFKAAEEALKAGGNDKLLEFVNADWKWEGQQ